jgi:SAM-dependent methyltransferase
VDDPRSESVPCPVCSQLQTRVWFQGDGFAMGTCRGCGLIRQQPRLTFEALRHGRYDQPKGDVKAGPVMFRPEAYEGLENWESKPQEAFLGSVAAVEATLPEGAPRGLWIDVGCNTGGLLVAAKKRGFPVAGVDLSSDFVRIARETHGADARVGSLAEARFADGCAGVVSYRQVLEHVHDLDRELAEVRRVLAPGGRLLVEVPHGTGMRLLQDRLRVALRIIPRSRMLRNVPEHLYYFRARHLVPILARHGFEALSVGTYGRYRRTRGIVRRSYDGLRDRLRLGNKLRVVAQRRADAGR